MYFFFFSRELAGITLNLALLVLGHVPVHDVGGGMHARTRALPSHHSHMYAYATHAYMRALGVNHILESNATGARAHLSRVFPECHRI